MNFKEKLGKIFRLLKELLALFFITDFPTFLSYFWAILTSFSQIIKHKSLWPASQKMKGKKTKFKVFNRQIVLSGDYFGRATEIYARKVYFPFPKFKLEKDMTVVDLGADVGVFSVLAGLIAKKVISLEPRSESLEKIRKNAEQNNCLDKIKIIWGMIGPNSGMVADPNISQKIFGSKKPPVLTMQDLFEKHDLKRIDFLKIDIEGSEFDLFKDNLNWLSEVDLIAMEVHASFERHGIFIPCGDINLIKKTLEKAGFKVWLVDINNRVVSSIKNKTGYLYAKNLKWE